jgi:hypothetical protein
VKHSKKILIIISIILFACSSHRPANIDNKKPVDTTASLATENFLPNEDMSRIYPDEFPVPTDIHFNIDSLKGLNFGNDTIDCSSILFQLFPGRIDNKYLNFVEKYGVAYWKCTSCPLNVLSADNYYDDNPMFDTLPFSNNYTFIVNKIEYRDFQGIESCLIAFSTSRSYPPMGRGEEGLLSLALFKKRAQWELVTFNPFVDFQGNFSTAQPPDSVIILPGKCELFIMRGGTACSPATWDYTPVSGNLYFYDSKTCSEILKVNETFCFNNGRDFGSKWNSQILVSDTNFDITIIKIIINGIIDKKNIWSRPDYINQIEKSRYKMLPREFNFEIIYNYLFFDRVAKLKNKEMTLIYRNKLGNIEKEKY